MKNEPLSKYQENNANLVELAANSKKANLSLIVEDFVFNAIGDAMGNNDWDNVLSQIELASKIFGVSKQEIAALHLSRV